jgi:hypothetical protein
MDPCFARALIEINEQKAADSAEKLYAVLGNSHAANTARSLEKAGKNVLCLTERSWKISADSVAAVTANLSGQSDQPDLVIIQVLDNNTFFVARDDGTLSLPRKGVDKKFHVEGDLTVASKDQINLVLKSIKPLLTAAPTVPKVLVLPMPRYAHKKCCDRQGHVANMGPGLLADLTAGLKSVKKSVRSFLFREKISGVRIFDPYSVVNFEDPESFADPVHLKTAGYAAIADGILESMAGGAGGDSAADPPSATENKRIRILSVSGRGGTGSVRGRGNFRGGPAARGGRPRRGGGSLYY